MAATLVQRKAGARTSSGQTLVLTFDNPTTPGNTIVVAAACYGTTTALSAADNKSNVYGTSVNCPNVSDTTVATIMHTYNIAGGASHQVTITAAVNTYVVAEIFEFAGMPTTDPIDKTQKNIDGTDATYTSNATDTTSQAGECMVGLAYDPSTGSVTLTPDASWSEGALTATTSGETLRTQYRIVTSAAAYQANGTATGSTNYRLCAIATYMEATGGSPPTVPIKAIRNYYRQMKG